MLQKNLNLKIRSNMTKDEIRALQELETDEKLRVHKSFKGFGFALVTDDTEKLKDQ